ncbi:hypothetical protein DB30_05404 [Enhygromyxa salina]|uniref:Uncharacterized protein n=1 Tax=Enhygromyxa salina TaxID=215803 RepID=A0A0C2CXB2_9BACT|nr:hypothetical protein DB30_05404 [Enhygromyxa salina]
MMTLAVGCADDEEPIGDIGSEAGESEGGEAEGGEGEGGEELEACIETVTVLADPEATTPQGHRSGEILDLAVGARVLNFLGVASEEGVSVMTSAPAASSVDVAVAYDSGEIRYIDSVASDGSEAECSPRVEADVTLRVSSEDEFFDAEIEAVLIGQITEDSLEAPTLLHEAEDLAELGALELVEIKPADPSSLGFAISFSFAKDGVTGELGGTATYEDPGVDGDVIVSAHAFKLFAFSE